MDIMANFFWTFAAIVILFILTLCVIGSLILGKVFTKTRVKKDDKFVNLKLNIRILIIFYLLSTAFLTFWVGWRWALEMAVSTIPIAAIVLFIILEVVGIAKEVTRKK